MTLSSHLSFDSGNVWRLVTFPSATDLLHGHDYALVRCLVSLGKMPVGDTKDRSGDARVGLA